MVQDRKKVTTFTHRKLHTGRNWWPWMSSVMALFCVISLKLGHLGPITSQWLKFRPILFATQMWPKESFFGNIWCMVKLEGTEKKVCSVKTGTHTRQQKFELCNTALPYQQQPSPCHFMLAAEIICGSSTLPRKSDISVTLGWICMKRHSIVWNTCHCVHETWCRFACVTAKYLGPHIFWTH